MTEERKRKIAEKNKHIPTEEIEVDLQDTKADVARWLAEIDSFERMPNDSPDAKIARIRASARRRWVDEAHIFIQNLEAILEVRKNG